ncbi:hypothetical protein niasHT_038166 [Heterodera trifolii]|uniref:Serpin domain-containing protein n=1 Tax=Heterodera trifolii TaxID=157864 RepID=A0ABD2IEU7_9BILA
MSSPPSPNVACILEAQADFALKLLREVSTDDRSCIVSPFSVAVTLSMVYAGAKEKTGEEMGQLLAKAHKNYSFAQMACRRRCDLRTGTGQICRSRFATSRSLQMHKVKGHTALSGAARMFAGNICPVGCANEKSFQAHTKRKHPETATPPALIEGAMVIPYKPGVAIFMGISRGLGYPVAICVEKSTDVNLAPGELLFAAGNLTH